MFQYRIVNIEINICRQHVLYRGAFYITRQYFMEKFDSTYTIYSRHPLIEMAHHRVSRYSVEISRTYPHAVTQDMEHKRKTLLG